MPRYPLPSSFIRIDLRAEHILFRNVLPRCGDQMVNRRGELYCEAGNMDLSRFMERLLKDLCELDPPPDTDRSTRTDWGGRWHCPFDGTRMSATKYLLPMCPQCSRVLPSNLVYQLIEVHQHLRGSC
jgi:hypothetical protein